MHSINAKIIADSINEHGNRIISYILTYPRFIHSELMTHRLFSRNSASSRAIPFEKMIKMVEEDPFVPIAWQQKHVGMQGSFYIEGKELETIKESWIQASRQAILMSKVLNQQGVTKQLCNRLLEPFMWHTTLITSTEFSNFFELRCPKYLIGEFKSKKDANKAVPDLLPFGVHDEKDILWWLKANKSQAEIHIQALAEAMWDAKNESIPNKLEEDEWHIPFQDKIDFSALRGDWITLSKLGKSEIDIKLKITTARCARLSYMTFDGEIDYEKDIKLHDQLLESRHMSPFEHCAKTMTEKEYDSFYKGEVFLDGDEVCGTNENGHGWCNNFKGFIQYRYLIENGNKI